MFKRVFIALFVLLAAFILISCDEVDEQLPDGTDLEKLVEIAEDIDLNLEVTDNFELPTQFDVEGVSVIWSSNNAAIFIVSNNQAVVTRADNDVTVEITGSFTLNEATHDFKVSVVVKAREALDVVVVEFTVTLPVGTPMEDDIYIAGDFGAGSGMPSWDPGHELGKATRVDETTATLSISYEDIQEPVTIKYKWTRGNWDTVEKNADGSEMEDRSEVILTDFAVFEIHDEVLKWADIEVGLDDAGKLAAAKNALSLPSDVMDNFNLPATQSGVSVTWASDSNAVVVNGATAEVTRQEDDVVATLTATLKIGDLTDTETFAVKVLAIGTEPSEDFELTFVVTLPANTPEDADIYILGNFPAHTGLLAWDDGIGHTANKLTRDGLTATITIYFETYEMDYELKYKFTRGAWITVEADSEAKDISDRIYKITGFQPTHEVEQAVLTWIDLGVPATNDTQKVEQAVNALTLPSSALENFNLPATGLHETVIAWASSDEAITITDGVAVLTRGLEDKVVELTATVTLGEVSEEKVFEVTVVKADAVYYETLELTINVTLPEDTPADADIFIFGNFPENTGLSAWGGLDNPLNKLERDGLTASITISFIELVENVNLEFKFTRGTWVMVEGGEFGETISNRHYEITRLLETHSIDLDILSWEDVVKHEQAVNELEITNIILEDFELPLLGSNNTVISWVSNDDAITITDGVAVVTNGTEDMDVELTATITLGDLTATKVFTVTVKAEDTQYFETFELTINVTLPANTPADADIFIFGSFPENTGLDAWGGVDNPLNKLVRDGLTASITISFPALTENVDIHYKITRGSWVMVEGNAFGKNMPNRHYGISRLLETHEIDIDVLGWEDVTNLEEATENLDITRLVSGNFELPGAGLHSTVITWASNSEAITMDGLNATVVLGTEDEVVVLTATITLGDIHNIKEFEVTVTQEAPPVYEDVTVVITATLPAGTPADATISLGGTFGGGSGLPNWAPDSPLMVATKNGLEATFTINFTGLQGNLTFLYKWTRGSWETVEKGSSGEELDNRSVTIDRSTATVELNDVVLKWADLSVDTTPPTVVGNLEIITDFLMYDGEDVTRTIRIWTPEGYDPESDKTYPVIYMHDGQNLFDAKTSFAGEWEVDETVMRMITAGLFDGVIVVGIDNSGNNRIDEYTPNWSDQPEAGGAKYAQFIVETLKPYIDLNYNTKPEREHTMVAGSSMGGLISFYMGLEYADVFGMVGAFSTSFQINTPEARQAFINALDSEGNLPRLIIDAGTEESLHTYVPLVVSELTDAGYPEALIQSEVHEGHGHNEASWRARLESALIWLFDLEPVI